MKDHIQNLIDLALAEDIGVGDITTTAIIDPKARGIGMIASQQPLVLAGMDVAKRVFQTVEPGISWDARRQDGTRCENGDIIATVEGSARGLLAAERTALNFLQKLSGVATLTNLFAHAVRDKNVKILDTRKTTPGFRALEKYAVRMGGGTNHRMGLYDHFLVKSNHVDSAGSLSAALERAMKARQPGQLVWIEARNVKEVKEALDGGADIILLDNMSVNDVRDAVRTVRGRTKVEVSGNINLESLISYAATGIDYISVGTITHSAPAVDIHMTLKIE
ncbi:MAG: carboxylating nicotinate-nucleotide diphosphorylase [Pseudomonadota bacterium]